MVTQTDFVFMKQSLSSKDTRGTGTIPDPLITEVKGSGIILHLLPSMCVRKLPLLCGDWTEKKTLSAVLFYRSWKNIAFRIKIYCLL